MTRGHVVHVVVTDNFAGTERYVLGAAIAMRADGWRVTVIGGAESAMRAPLRAAGVAWLPGARLREAARALASIPRAELLVSHMTAADLVACRAGARRGIPVVSVRHFAATRGRSVPARLLGRWVARRIAGQIAGSRFVAANVEGVSTVVAPGVASLDDDGAARTPAVLVAQRLESEKHTALAIRAWSLLPDRGEWRLLVAGDGADRGMLVELAAQLGVADSVDFLGFQADIDACYRRASVFLATAPAEPFGFSVLEAMAHGLPVVASAGGGHLETAGAAGAAAELFRPGDAEGAAQGLATLLASAATRAERGASLRDFQRARFDAATQGRVLSETLAGLAEAGAARLAARHRPGRGGRARPAPAGGAQGEAAAAADGADPVARAHPARPRRLVVVSLEPWDEVWRRNQYLLDRLLRAEPTLEVLVVEPPVDPVHELRRRRLPRRAAGLRTLDGYEGRLHALQPTKWLPRALGPAADAGLRRAALRAVRRLGWRRPLLWLNDPRWAGLLRDTDWPALYDVTDDWMLADRPPRERARLAAADAALLAGAAEVVVCSPALAVSKGATRPVRLIPNAVDLERARQPHPRPGDLPDAPVALYAGTLHEDRLDVALSLALARALAAAGGRLVLLGPVALGAANRDRLEREPGVRMLGARPREAVAAYLQHAEVLVVPHLVDDFTDSLDPIKRYEYRAAGRPVVSTPVAGFREAAGDPGTVVASGDGFVAAAVAAALSRAPSSEHPDVPDWSERAREMAHVLDRLEH